MKVQDLNTGVWVNVREDKAWRLATNIHRWSQPVTDDSSAGGEDTPPAEDTVETVEELFDPSGHTVAEVVAYLATVDDDEKARVMQLEIDGKARVGITGL